jgi:hypothetical protein
VFLREARYVAKSKRVGHSVQMMTSNDATSSPSESSGVENILRCVGMLC